MAVYFRPIPGIPPRVRERVESQGLDVAIATLRGQATTATGLSDATNAAVYNAWVTALQSSAAFTGSHGASARLGVYVLQSNIHASNP